MSRLWTDDDGRRNVKIELEFWKQNSQYLVFLAPLIWSTGWHILNKRVANYFSTSTVSPIPSHPHHPHNSAAGLVWDLGLGANPISTATMGSRWRRWCPWGWLWIQALHNRQWAELGSNRNGCGWKAHLLLIPRTSFQTQSPNIARSTTDPGY